MLLAEAILQLATRVVPSTAYVEQATCALSVQLDPDSVLPALLLPNLLDFLSLAASSFQATMGAVSLSPTAAQVRHGLFHSATPRS